MEDKSYLTVDLGGTKTAVAIGFDSGEIVGRKEFATGDVKTTLKKIYDIADPLVERYRPSCIGISCGGPLNSRSGTIICPPNMPGWKNVKIVELFESHFGLRTFLENDANAGAIAEWLYGAGRGYDNVLFLTCGTGLGAGLILDRRLYRGKQDLAGEIGHIRMEADGPVGFYKAGSLEGFASGGGLTQLARKKLSEPHPKSILDELDIERVTAKDVGQAALAGDELAKSLVAISGRYLGRGLAILIDTLNPECIVLGSMAVRLGRLLLEPAMEEVRKEAIEEAWRNCVIVPAKLGERIGDIAALCVAKYNSEQEG